MDQVRIRPLWALRKALAGWVALAACAAALPSLAEEPASAQGAYTRLEPLALYEDGTGPGWHDWPGNLGIEEEGVMGGPAGAIFNVSVPTLTPYLPDARHNTGTAVIVAPGGAFRLLAMAHEGHQVAEWLAQRGIAAFLLKYRLAQMKGPDDFGASMQRMPIDQAGVMGVADGKRAVALVRSRAAEYRIDPARVGIVGFSAGAHVAAEVGLSADARERASFVAPIYGGPFGTLPQLPKADSDDALPPFFLAIAVNDPVVDPGIVLGFTQALIAAGYEPELHLFKDGGHGFGMTRQGTTSDLWIEQFHWWMTTQGLTRKPGEPAHEVKTMPGPDLGGAR